MTKRRKLERHEIFFWHFFSKVVKNPYFGKWKKSVPKTVKLVPVKWIFFSIFLNREINFLTLVLLSLMDLQRWVLKWNEILLWLVFVNFCLFITGNAKIWTSKGDENLVRITGSSNNWKLSFPSNFQLNLNGMDFSEVIEALWLSIA